MMKKLLNSKGSVTLEATIIIPLISLILFSLIFFSMYVYHRLVILDAAIYTAKQGATTWDNSGRNLETGSLKGQISNDGLYWRLFNDFNSSNLALAKTAEGTLMLSDKLADGVLREKGTRNIKLTYHNSYFKRTLSAEVAEDIKLPRWLESSMGTGIVAKAEADVAEPVEYIRNIDVLEKYLKEIKDYIVYFIEQPRVIVTKASYDDINPDNNVYHTDPNCRYAKTIRSNGNTKTFNSPEAAVGEGYRECKICARQKNTK